MKLMGGLRKKKHRDEELEKEYQAGYCNGEYVGERLGYNLGFNEGKMHGYNDGRMQERRKVIMAMKDNDISNEKIAMILGISLEEIEDILVTQKLILK